MNSRHDMRWFYVRVKRRKHWCIALYHSAQWPRHRGPKIFSLCGRDGDKAWATWDEHELVTGEDQRKVCPACRAKATILMRMIKPETEDPCTTPSGS